MNPDHPSRENTPSAHPDEEVLIAHVSGHLDCAYRVLVEAHLASCARCRQDLAQIQMPGGLVLTQIPESLPPPGLWERLEAQLPLPAADQVLSDTPLPPAAQSELPPTRRPPRWRNLPLSTARATRLWSDPAAQVELFLVRTHPGSRFPGHVHLGAEQGVVLCGGYEDQVGHFQTGDFMEYPPASAHAPQVDDEVACWVVTRVERGVRFQGWRGVLQRLLA